MVAEEVTAGAEEADVGADVGDEAVKLSYFDDYGTAITCEATIVSRMTRCWI